MAGLIELIKPQANAFLGLAEEVNRHPCGVGAGAGLDAEGGVAVLEGMIRMAVVVSGPGGEGGEIQPLRAGVDVNRFLLVSLEWQRKDERVVADLKRHEILIGGLAVGLLVLRVNDAKLAGMRVGR